MKNGQIFVRLYKWISQSDTVWEAEPSEEEQNHLSLTRSGFHLPFQCQLEVALRVMGLVRC